MSTDEYVPSEAEMIAGLVQLPDEPAGLCRRVRPDEMKRGLARVRRDAAREALAQAEHRIARLEAQTSIRGRAVAIYRNRAREAETDRDLWREASAKLAASSNQANADLYEAEARIKAVRDVHTGTVWPGVADKPICDACDQMWPCATTRALEG